MLLLTLLIIFVSSSTCSEVRVRQKRAWIIDSYSIDEEHPGPFPYLLGKVNIDRAYRVYFELHGQGVDLEPKNVLQINKETGEIFVLRPVDYEKHQMLKLSFEAKKTENFLIDTRLGVEILVNDINDNPPLFERPLYEVTVEEDRKQGSHLTTVLAYDEDKRDTLNSTFHYHIKSVSPKTPNIEFTVKETGALSFKGCFDHEVASKYTLLVEAIDQGEVVKLSSSTTVVINVEDGNNHLPVITGQTGSGKVNENEFGVSPLRLHAKDSDMFQTKAWRVRYTILGDKEGQFKIETDTETNDGILTVVKPLDFEEGATRELKISFENEAPYHSCKVKSRPFYGLWDVDITNEESGGIISKDTTTVVIEVVDVNDPPVFTVTVKEAKLQEDAAIGTWVEKVTAVDRDSSSASEFIYKVGHDPAGWMKIDPNTGDITTIKRVDRESIHVVNNTYTLILHAVDKGQPSMTGTATLQIYLIDVNDNLPQLTVNDVDVCLSDGPIPTNISATDQDGMPFGGPFIFELLGDVKGKWKLDPSFGFNAGLVRESGAYAGYYTLKVKVSDLQGEYSVCRLNVTVCSCSVAHNCRSRNGKTHDVGGVVGIALASLVLTFLVLLAAIKCTCKEDFSPLQTDYSGCTGHLKDFHTEIPGTDCKVLLHAHMKDGDKDKNSPSQVPKGLPTEDATPATRPRIIGRRRTDRRTEVTKDWEWTGTDKRIDKYHWEGHMERDRSSVYRSWSKCEKSYKYHEIRFHSEEGALVATRNLLTVDNLPDYEPHVYAEEGDQDAVSDLDYKCDEKEPSLASVLEDLGPAFEDLASVCISPQLQIKSTKTKTIFVQHDI
ncbi:cadherin-like protein 26 [Fundulus heteroclitus]|uniref:cadherin-like protein 26 n=1 Tax=Fundulus heteroclitus TaxID=8078 RepID=UPI00165AE9E4|nr:cadherin-like protein 26 [Fundulus heteroclitus]